MPVVCYKEKPVSDEESRKYRTDQPPAPTHNWRGARITCYVQRMRVGIAPTLSIPTRI
jgi:hypothetical protein